MQIQNKATYSIVVPLFNEEENVGPLVDSVLSAVDDHAGFSEIILVDDGSRDKTAELAAALAQRDKCVRLVKHDRNKGLGAAICTGLGEARSDYALYTDADLPFDFKLIPDLIGLAAEDSVVAGYRLNRGEGARRLFLTKVYNLIIWLLYGFSLNDVNFACKIFPKRFLQNAELRSEGSFIDVELLLESRRLGLTIVEQPLVYYPRERGLSTLSRPGVIFGILREMFVHTFARASKPDALTDFIANSPLITIAVAIMTAATSIFLLFSGHSATAPLVWLLLTIEITATAIFLGWRIGLVAAGFGVVAMELIFLSGDQTFLAEENLTLLVWAMLGVLCSQVSSGGWKLVQRSFKLTTSE